MSRSLICLATCRMQEQDKESRKEREVETFIEMARRHLQKHLSTLYERLQREGQLEEHLARAARMAEEELLGLVSDEGMRMEEAMEIVLPKYILIDPESAQATPLES